MFQKDLVPFFIGKAHHFILDGRAVARAGALDHPGVEGGTVQVGADDLVRLLVGIGKVAGRLSARHPLRKEGKGVYVRFPLLDLQFRIVDGTPVHARRSARLKAAHLKAEVDEVLCKEVCGRESVRPGTLLIFPRDDFALEVYARSEDDHFCRNDLAYRRPDARHFSVFREDLCRLALQQRKVFGIFQHLFHAGVIGVLVRLGAQALYRRALARIEHAYLQGCLVGIDAHFAAERVDLAHEVPLRRAADGRIARHKGDAVEV